MKKLLKRLSSTRGEGYIDISVAVLVVMILLVAVIKIAPVFITKMTINNYANELCREAEIAGRVGTETTTRPSRPQSYHYMVKDRQHSDWKHIHGDSIYYL